MNTLQLFIAFGAGIVLGGWLVWMRAEMLIAQRDFRECERTRAENVMLAELARQRDVYRRAWIVADVSMTLRNNLSRQPQNFRNN